MDKNKKVGIVIPSYNQGKYIEHAIQSVLANQKNCDIDLVVMDGGSTDETLSVLNQYKDKFYYWQSKKDDGQADAINQGMMHLRHCDYVMWLNSDDVFDSEYSVRYIRDMMCSRQIRAAYGKSCLIDEEGNKTGIYPTEVYDRARLGVCCYISQPSVMIEQRLWEECQGLNPRLQMCLDYEMWIRVSQYTDFVYCKEYIGNTRIYGETKTSTMQLRHLKEGITILKHYYKRVPLRWLRSLYIEEHPDSIWSKYETHVVWKIFLSIYVWTKRRKMIRRVDLSKELLLER